MIQPIVEGHGEVEAVPVLLRRFVAEAGVFDVRIGTPIRRRRPELVREDSLRRAVELARRQPGCSAILVLFDGDDDCPRALAPTIERWASDAAAGVPCAVVMAHREYEAWFLAAIESLVGPVGLPEGAPRWGDPEAPRDAKGLLERAMFATSGYHARVDQPSLTARFDLSSAYRRSRSFRRMTGAFGSLLRARGTNIAAWPPEQWTLAQP